MAYISIKIGVKIIAPKIVAIDNQRVLVNNLLYNICLTRTTLLHTGTDG